MAAAALSSTMALGQPSPAPMSPSDELRLALMQLTNNYDTIAKRMGPEQTADLQERLSTDLGWMMGAATPFPGYSAEAWSSRVGAQAHMDADIVTQVLAGKSGPIAGSGGLVERLVVSRKDGLLAPFALYVPANAAANPTLVVLLHGHPQTDSDIIAGRYFRQLADDTGTIVAAPYGRGIYEYASPADDEVYQVTAEVASAFHVPPNRVFLAGYSMGGFAVFKIGRVHPEQWAGVMSIAGSVLSTETELVRRAFGHTPIYVVTGTGDDQVPTDFAQSTAVYLDSVGIPTGLYIVPSGTHSIVTINPMLSAAWHDMLTGKIRASARPQRNGRVALPSSIDLPPGMKP
jgi:S-formylglutathione hydrolase FrmB